MRRPLRTPAPPARGMTPLEHHIRSVQMVRVELTASAT